MGDKKVNKKGSEFMNPFSKKTSLISKEELAETVRLDLMALKSATDSENKVLQLKEIAKACMLAKDWNLSWEVINDISDENVRNLMLADMIEEYLIPAGEYSKAKEFSKFLLFNHEITPLILIRLAIAEDNQEEAIRYVEQLPTPQSKNYALCHITESYLMEHDKLKAIEIGKIMMENVRAISDPILQSYSLRDIAKNLFLANGEKELAREVAEYIIDESIKKRLLTNIECS